MSLGWFAHPDDGDEPSARPLPSPNGGKIVATGALCEVDERCPIGGDLALRISEFAELSDGSRVVLHDERGVTVGTRGGPGAPPISEGDIVQSVLEAVLPDGEESADDHPWDWLADLARARGLDVAGNDLRSLPYKVVLGEALRVRLRTR